MKIKNSIAYFKRTTNSSEKAQEVDLSSNSPSHINYSEDISIFFLVEDGDSYSYVLNEDLKKSNLTVNELLTIGIQNLKVIANEIEIKKNSQFIYFVGSGTFEATLLLIDEIWDKWLSEQCPNGCVAAIPARTQRGQVLT